MYLERVQQVDHQLRSELTTELVLSCRLIEQMRCMRCVHNDLFFLETWCGRGIPNIGSATAVCRYGKPESEWKRARDTDLVRCAQEWARSEARGTLTGTATQAKQ